MNQFYILLALFFSSSLFAQTNGFAKNSQIQNVSSINSTQLDFSPTYYNNGIVFVSNRTQELSSIKGNRKDNKIDDHFMALYYSEKDIQSGTLKTPEPFSSNLTARFHEGPLCFSQNGNRLFFTQNHSKGVKQNKQEKVRYLNIYTAEKKENDWDNIEALPFNTEGYEECHPSISANGLTLIFASNRPGGFGGMDLYQSQLINNQWSAPKNLGNHINTAKNEVFPFLHPDGTLYFASNGWEGLGGLDIYNILLSNAQKTKPNNLGQPVNSEKDDFGWIINHQKTEGYFSSNRINGQGKDDIYRYTQSDNNGITIPSERGTTATICLYDKNTQETINNTAVRVLKKRKDGTISSLSGKRLMVMQPTNDTNQYSLKMEFPEVNKTYENRTYYTDEKGKIQISLLPNETYIFVVEPNSYEKTEKILFTQKNTNWSFCLPLAKKTIQCMVLKGKIQEEANTKFLTNAQLTLKSNCSGETWQVHSDDLGAFNFPCQLPNCDFSLTIQKEGYQQKIIAIEKQSFLNHSLINNYLIELPKNTNFINNEVFYEKGRSPLSVGSTFELENIYYDFNDYHLRHESTKSLDKLTQFLLKNPSLEIELSAHTDSRGGARANQKLSQKRADYAVRYLKNKGISGHRLRPIGYGESNLRNDCNDGTPCSKEAHQYNRRMEVKILQVSSSSF